MPDPGTTGPTPMEETGPGWQPDADVDPWDSWSGWDEEGEGPREAYGIDNHANRRAWILVPGRIEVVDGVIPTDRFNMGTIDEDPELGGFIAIDADNDTTDGMQGLDVGADLSGEGVRGRNAAEEGDHASAVFFETDTTLAYGTMGCGFVNLSTTHEGYSTSAKMYYNYSALGSEPIFRGTKEDISMPGNTIKFTINNPFDYSEDESNALRSKFGWDPTLGTGRYINAYKDGFDRSINKIVKALITTYPINLATFPRTPPLKIKRSDKQRIRRREQREEDAPTGIEAVTSTMDSDY